MSLVLRSASSRSSAPTAGHFVRVVWAQLQFVAPSAWACFHASAWIFCYSGLTCALAWSGRSIRANSINTVDTNRIIMADSCCMNSD